MVYKNHLVAAIKVGGKILRESGNEVLVPFGSEYSILLKNLNSARVKVRISVDGKDATEGTSLVIGPNSSLELERFIRNGNLNSGNRFKFIERTKEIEDHRGIEAEDGLIRVEYFTEKITHVQHEYVRYYDDWRPYWLPWDHYQPCYPPYNYPIIWCGTPLGSSGSGFQNCNNATQAQNASLNFCSANASNLSGDAGITVEGAKSEQTFRTVSDFSTDPQSDVLVLRLRGVAKGKKITQAVTVDKKSKCKTCGLTNKSAAQFCSRCGTALEII